MKNREKKQIKIRKSWGDFCPTTRVKESKKKYKRERFSPFRDSMEYHESFA